MAFCRSACAKQPIAGRPASQALMMLFNRLLSGIPDHLAVGQGPGPLCLARLQTGVKARVDATGISFENLMPVVAAQVRTGVKIALGIVEIIAGYGIAALDRADHFGPEQDVVYRNDASD